MIKNIDKAILYLKDCGLNESEMQLIVSDSIWPELKKFCKRCFGTWRYGKIIIISGLVSDDPNVNFIVCKQGEKIVYKNGKAVAYTDVWEK